MKLTELQNKTLQFIVQTIEQTGIPPTLREIASHFNWKAVGSAQDVIVALKKKGALENNIAGKSRQIRPTMKSQNSDKLNQQDQFFQVPLLGTVQAGNPLEAFENSTEFISFPVLKKANQSEKYFALKIEGFSMLYAGFLPGDSILVEYTQNAADKDIVVACVNHSEVTVKRFAQKNSKLYKNTVMQFQNTSNAPPLLIPENPKFKPIPFGLEEDDKIIGVVKSLFRNKVY